MARGERLDVSITNIPDGLVKFVKDKNGKDMARIHFHRDEPKADNNNGYAFLRVPGDSEHMTSSVSPRNGKTVWTAHLNSDTKYPMIYTEKGKPVIKHLAASDAVCEFNRSRTPQKNRDNIAAVREAEAAAELNTAQASTPASNNDFSDLNLNF